MIDEITVESVESQLDHRIVCAAVKLKDGRVICGVRHFDGLMRMSLPTDLAQARELLLGHKEGFVDNFCMFLDRNEAWDVALAAKQLDPEDAGYRGNYGMLFSEDMW